MIQYNDGKFIMLIYCNVVKSNCLTLCLARNIRGFDTHKSKSGVETPSTPRYNVFKEKKLYRLDRAFFL